MSLMTDAIEYRRLRAPQQDGGTLIDPPRTEVADLLAQNQSLLVQFRDAATLARRELIDAAFSYTRQYRDVAEPDPTAPLLLAGHQPQMFHPGVWFKNFVLGQLAQDHSAVAVNLIIDSDAMRSASIRVPTGIIANPIAEAIPFDQAGGEVPYEEHAITDRELFESFAARAKTAIGPLVPNPMIQGFWPIVVERANVQSNLGLAISQARHTFEGRWGTSTLELPQSHLCEFASFRRFAISLLAEAARLRDVYNSAILDYRHANHIRSKAHPVPELIAHDGWVEAPFWIWTTDEPRRRRLFVKQSAGELLLTDRGQLKISLALSQETALEQLASLERRGIKLRTRALITTMFARLMLGDLFLHGIGGAKYDQVTDAIIRRYFGVEPPAFLTVTATLRLPIARPNVSGDDLRRVEHQLRDLEFHPELWLDHSNVAAQKQVAEKRRWIATPQTRENGRERCRAIRFVNESLQPRLSELHDKLIVERDALRHDLTAEKILGSREYAFCLYPEENLRQLFEMP